MLSRHPVIVGSLQRRYAARRTLLAAAVLVGCSDSSIAGPLAHDPAGTYQSPLTSLGGSGTGGVSVTPQSIPQGYFTAVIKVRVHSAKPNTMYTVQRAPEIGRPLGSDGVCQRALGISPWSPSDPPAPSFLTFLQPDHTSFTLMTSASGDGSLDFTFAVPAIAAGTHFDVMFRVLNDVVAPTSVFLSGCFTVTVL